MFGTLGLLSLISMPHSFSELEAGAGLKLEWQERRESGEDLSRMNLAARLGIFPKLDSNLFSGLEIATGSTTLGALRGFVPLTGGTESRTIVLQQAYLSGIWGESFQLQVSAGKFAQSLPLSLMSWDPELYPEGGTESLILHNQPLGLRAALVAGQWNLDQAAESVVNGTGQRRSWLLLGGATFSYKSDYESEILFAAQYLYFTDLSEKLAAASGPLGNSISGNPNTVARFKTHYAPVEFTLRAEARPLGLRVGVEGSILVNFRSPEKDRGFMATAYNGELWKAREICARVGYFYLEPDATLAFLSWESLGGTNRKGPFLRLDFFPRNELGIYSNLIFSDILAKNSYQSRRYEFRGGFEMKI